MAMEQPSYPSRRQRFEALAAEVFEPLQRYARRRVDPDSVDDIVSETLTTLWRRLDDVPAEAGLAWAYGVARRHVANHRRGARRHLRLIRRVEAEPRQPREDGSPFDAELDAALASLADGDRE
ncbi:MAG: RNA polymerase sigma factor, partial [Acidimicrobiia bacterium]